MGIDPKDHVQCFHDFGSSYMLGRVLDYHELSLCFGELLLQNASNRSTKIPVLGG